MLTLDKFEEASEKVKEFAYVIPLIKYHHEKYVANFLA